MALYKYHILLLLLYLHLMNENKLDNKKSQITNVPKTFSFAVLHFKHIIHTDCTYYTECIAHFQLFGPIGIAKLKILIGLNASLYYNSVITHSYIAGVYIRQWLA